MKRDDVFQISLYDLTKPLEGRVVDVTITGEPGPVHCRIKEVKTNYYAEVEVIPDSVKE